MITFSQLNQGDPIHVLEVVGSFKKTTNYFLGTIGQISSVYEEQATPQLFPMPNQPKRKLVDITINCGGEQLKLTVDEGKTIVNDTSVGLTVATDKKLIHDKIKNQYDMYKAKKEAISKYDEEMDKCDAILKQLNYREEPAEDTKIKALEDEIKELKDIIKLASSMVPAPMKQMLPENIQNKINEVDQ